MQASTAHRLVFFAVLGGLLALHLGMAWQMRVPMLFGDETAYLGMARYLAGDAPDLRLAIPDQPFGAFLPTGYSLLLVPAVALAGSAAGAYRAALLVNCLCAAGTFAVLAAFARRVLSLSFPRAIGAALVASVYPALLLQSNLSWSESLLCLLIPALSLAFLHLAEARSTTAALGLAALTAGSYWVHPRTLGLIPLALVALWLLHRRSGLPRAAALAGAATLLLLALAARGTDSWVWGRLNTGAARYGEAQALAQLAQPDNLLAVFLSAAGQLWYLAAATAGTALLGGWLLARRVARTSPDASPADGPRRWAAGYALASWGLLFLTSSAFMITTDRADKLIYGRYWEPALSLLLVAAVAGFWERPAGKAGFAAFGLTALTPAGLGLAVVTLREGSAFQRVFNHLNVLGISQWVVAMGGLRILWISLIGTGAGLALLALARRHPTGAAGALGLFFLAGGLYTFSEWVLPSNLYTMDNLRIPAEVEQIPEATAIAFDQGHLTFNGFSAYPFWLDTVRIAWFDSRRGQRPPAELVISSRDWSAPASARMVYAENFNGQALWVLPGRLQDRLAAAGALLPPDPAGPIPAEACHSRIEILGDSRRDLRIEQGSSHTFRLRLTHRGRGAPWVSTAALGTPDKAVRISVQWYQGNVFAADDRVELPFSLAPGDQAELDLVLAPDTAARKLPPGRYEVRIGLLQEMVLWCRDVGDPTLTLRVEVREGSRLADLF